MKPGLHVGRRRGVKNRIFIGATKEIVDKAVSPLTKERLTIIHFTEDDARWIIDALRKELRHSRRKQLTTKEKVE